METPEEKIELVKKTVLDILQNDLITTTTPNFKCSIDDSIVHGFVSRGLSYLLPSDISYGPQCGGLAEGFLCKLANENTIIENVDEGKIRLSIGYGIHSVRFFVAHNVK